MSRTINVSTESSGGYSVAYSDGVISGMETVSNLTYVVNGDRHVSLYPTTPIVRGVKAAIILPVLCLEPEGWTIEGVTGFTTTAEVQAALIAILPAGSGVDADGFLILPNTVTGFNVRIGQRTGFVYAVDQELTETGFDGTEGVDWINISGNTTESV